MRTRSRWGECRDLGRAADLEGNTAAIRKWSMGLLASGVDGGETKPFRLGSVERFEGTSASIITSVSAFPAIPALGHLAKEISSVRARMGHGNEK